MANDIIVPGWTSKNKPDVGWWNSQIAAGIEERDKRTYKSKWQSWENRYKNEYSPIKTPLPINLFFMMIRTMVPRLYFRNPSISVTPAKPGPEQLGLATLIQRIDNRVIKTMNLKREMKKMAQAAFFHGTSFGKLGYGAEFLAPPTSQLRADNAAKRPWASVDYRADIRADQPWFLHTPTNHYVAPVGYDDRLATPWEAHIAWRHKDDLNSDQRFDIKDAGSGASHTLFDGKDKADMVEVYEIHDRRTGQMFVMMPNTNDVNQLILKPQFDDLQTVRGGPFYHLGFNEVTDSMWALPDAQILEPFQREINDISTSLIHHSRITRRKFKATRDGLSQEEAENLVNGTLGGVVFVNDMNEVEIMQTGGIPPELLQLLERMMQIVQFTIGFSRNQFGEYRPGSEAPSATEANIVRQASEIRIDERRDMMADMMVDIVQDVNLMVAQRWNEDMIEQVVGPFGVPVWVRFSGEMLQSAEYEVKIDPDTSVPETKQAREAKAAQMFQMLYPLSQQPDARTGLPLIDSTKLTRFFTHEMQGTAYDDMMFGVPNIYDEQFVRALTQGQGNLNEPVSPEQLGGMFQQAPAAAQQLAGMMGGR